MWCKMTNAGENFDHQDRVINSKITNSNNLSSLYFLIKDHKNTLAARPVVTGCSGNSLGLSNSVSELLESVANSVVNAYEVISSEDLLAKIRECNKKVMKKIEEKMKRGEEIDWERELVVFGNDVVALFPSMTSANTGRIIRRQMQKSSMKIEGLDFQHVILYVMLNRHMTGDLGSLRRLFPWKRGASGVEPGMKNKNINSKNHDDILKTWQFPEKEPTEAEKRELVARLGEIGLRAVFENFMYTFAGESFLQLKGGPIGARVTMAAARLVMNDYSEQYRIILEKAKLEIYLLNGYVDDGRQGTSFLEMGMRFVDGNKEFQFREEWRVEDERKKLEGETTLKRMSTQCQIAMNSINPDLKFTVETTEEFEDNREPTLDFSIWLEKAQILHSYYEKAMKTPLLLMQKTAMSEQQKYSILSNELVRRLSNISHSLPEELGKKEKLWVTDTMTRQMKSSGYKRSEIAEAMVSGVRGYLRKCERRKKNNMEFYRHGKDTLKIRVKKKLIEKTSWYKEQKKDEDLEEEEEYREKSRGAGQQREKMEKPREKMEMEGKQEKQSRNKIKAVMFVPYTQGSKLAKKLRENEERMEYLTGYRLKIVERAGMKRENILHKSNHWSGENCDRKRCLLCDTKLKTE